MKEIIKDLKGLMALGDHRTNVDAYDILMSSVLTNEEFVKNSLEYRDDNVAQIVCITLQAGGMYPDFMKLVINDEHELVHGCGFLEDNNLPFAFAYDAKTKSGILGLVRAGNLSCTYFRVTELTPQEAQMLLTKPKYEA
jgi:hypothetical protein